MPQFMALTISESFLELSVGEPGGTALSSQRFYLPQKPLKKAIEDFLANNGVEKIDRVAVNLKTPRAIIKKRLGSSPAFLVTQGFENWVEMNLPVGGRHFGTILGVRGGQGFAPIDAGPKSFGCSGLFVECSVQPQSIFGKAGRSGHRGDGPQIGLVERDRETAVNGRVVLETGLAPVLDDGNVGGRRHGRNVNGGRRHDREWI